MWGWGWKTYLVMNIRSYGVYAVYGQLLATPILETWLHHDDTATSSVNIVSKLTEREPALRTCTRQARPGEAEAQLPPGPGGRTQRSSPGQWPQYQHGQAKCTHTFKVFCFSLTRIHSEFHWKEGWIAILIIFSDSVFLFVW